MLVSVPIADKVATQCMPFSLSGVTPTLSPSFVMSPPMVPQERMFPLILEVRLKTIESDCELRPLSVPDWCVREVSTGMIRRSPTSEEVAILGKFVTSEPSGLSGYATSGISKSAHVPWTTDA